MRFCRGLAISKKIVILLFNNLGLLYSVLKCPVAGTVTENNFKLKIDFMQIKDQLK